LGSLQTPLLVLGFALGVLVYVAAALWVVRSARATWEWALRVYWDRRTRAELVQEHQRVAAIQTIGPAERRARGRRAA
jgi:hypothetical protein